MFPSWTQILYNLSQNNHFPLHFSLLTSLKFRQVLVSLGDQMLQAKRPKHLIPLPPSFFFTESYSNSLAPFAFYCGNSGLPKKLELLRQKLAWGSAESAQNIPDIFLHPTFSPYGSLARIVPVEDLWKRADSESEGHCEGQARRKREERIGRA